MAKRVTSSWPGLAVLAAATLPLALAACESTPTLSTAPSSSPPPAEETAALPMPPPRKPLPPITTPAAPTPARLPPERPEAEPEPAGGFDRLIGLDQAHLTALMGGPQQRAEAPPATIWRYLGRGCELDVYFYFDLQSQAMRALHYEVRSHESREQPAQQCYDELVSERRARAEPAASTDSSR
jgi:hypothetical protein